MKTLVIHPKDKTTDFLKPIYHGRDDITVLTGGCKKEDVNKAIEEHDHIILMGHGTPQGLLAMGQFNGKPKVKTTPAGSRYLPAASGKGLTKLPEEDVSDANWYEHYDAGYKPSGYKPYSGISKTGYSSLESLTTSYIVDDNTADLLKGKKVTAIWCNADQYMEWNGLDGFYTGMFISDTSEATMIGTADTEQWQVDESNYGFVEVVRRNLDQDSDTLHKAVVSHYGMMADRNAVAKYNLKRLYSHKNSQVSRKSGIASI